MYNIEAYHHYSPSWKTPLFKLLYSSTMLAKDLKEIAEERKKAIDEANRNNMRALAQQRQNRSRQMTSFKRKR